MKWKMVKKGNKWKKRLIPDADEWITLLCVVLVVDLILLHLIIKGA